MPSGGVALLTTAQSRVRGVPPYPSAPEGSGRVHKGRYFLGPGLASLSTPTCCIHPASRERLTGARRMCLDGKLFFFFQTLLWGRGPAGTGGGDVPLASHGSPMARLLHKASRGDYNEVPRCARAENPPRGRVGRSSWGGRAE